MTSRNGQRWTNIEDEELLMLLEAGERLKRIAYLLGRTQAATAVRKTILKRSHLSLDQTGDTGTEELSADQAPQA